MPLSETFWDTSWTSDSGCGGADQSKFVRCIDGRDPELQKVWIRCDSRITSEVHSTARVEVNPCITRDFSTNYFT